jgi:hypothetical protein
MLADVVNGAAARGARRARVGLPAGVGVPDPRHDQGDRSSALDAAVAAGLPRRTSWSTPTFLRDSATYSLVGTLRRTDSQSWPQPTGRRTLALSDDGLFEPVYRPGSAERFAALAPSRRLDAESS